MKVKLFDELGFYYEEIDLDKEYGAIIWAERVFVNAGVKGYIEVNYHVVNETPKSGIYKL